MRNFLCYKKERADFSALTKFNITIDDEYIIELSEQNNPSNLITLRVGKDIAEQYQVDGIYKIDI